MAISHSNARQRLSPFLDILATIVTSLMSGAITISIAFDRHQD